MVELTTTTIQKEGVCLKGGLEYRILYVSVNGNINLVSCQIVKDNDGLITEVGTIKKENSQINAFISETVDYSDAISTFSEIVSTLD